MRRTEAQGRAVTQRRPRALATGREYSTERHVFQTIGLLLSNTSNRCCRLGPQGPQGSHWGPNTGHSLTVPGAVYPVPTPPLARWVPRHTCRGMHTSRSSLFSHFVIARYTLSLSPVTPSTGGHHSLVVNSSTGDYHPSFAVWL